MVNSAKNGSRFCASKRLKAPVFFVKVALDTSTSDPYTSMMLIADARWPAKFLVKVLVVILMSLAVAFRSACLNYFVALS
jgi:hypothetical protein